MTSNELWLLVNLAKAEGMLSATISSRSDPVFVEIRDCVSTLVDAFTSTLIDKEHE